MAFLGISAFAVLSAVAGTYAFRQVAYALERITEQRVPSAVAALDLSRQADRIVAAAPALLTADSQARHHEVSTAIADEAGRLEALLAQVRGSAADSAGLAAIESAVAGLRRNLDALDDLVARRLEVSARKAALLDHLSGATVTAQRLVRPGIVVMDSQIAALRRQIRSDQPNGAFAPTIGQLAKGIAENVPMQKAQIEFAAINDGLLSASAATSAADLPLAALPLNRSLAALRDLTRDLDPSLQPRFERLMGEFAQLIEGPDSIPEARATELALITRAEGLLAENAALSKQLTGAVDGLVTTAGRDIREAGAEAMTAQRVGRGVLVSVVVVSLLSSVLIVWLYVDRSLVARLTALSNSMLAIASGNLRAPLPSGGNDEIGRMAQALSVFRDTAIEVEEKNLREVANARQRLIDAIESISEGFALYDATDRLALCNSHYREILYPGIADCVTPGMAFETIVRRAVERGLVEDAKGREEEWIAGRLAAHRNLTMMQIQHRSPERWIQVNERRITGGGTVAIYTDISTLKRHEAELEIARDEAMAATQAKSKFLASMSHELRTPLNAIIGITEMLKDDAADAGQDELMEPLERIHRAGKHLLHLINEILDLSKIEAGKLALSLENVEVAPLLREAAATAEPLAARNGNRLEIRFGDDLGRLRADPVRLRQIVLNLLSNAAKFTERGVVTLEARREREDDADWIEVSVADTGIGLTQEQLGRLFQEFSQADSSTTRKYGGTGLGLAISLRLCRMMGGDIQVASERGQGSRFTLRIPVGAAEPSAAETTSSTEAAPRPVPTADRIGRVLVIDDEETVRDLMRRFLTREGFEVVTAKDGAEGLVLARELEPVLITLDVLMPGRDGWSVLEALKADPRLAEIPVVMLTILDEKSRGYALGADCYLTKPVDRERLRVVLSRYRRTGSVGRVLIVEDDHDTRSWLCRMLRDDGWVVTEAENGRAALQLLADAVPDLVLLDLIMPEMDGFEFLDELRRTEAGHGIPVIVITAAELDAADHERLNGSVLEVLQKSDHSREALLAELHELVARHCPKRAA